MKTLNSEETLWVILPILLVSAALVASIIILPMTQTNVTSKASTPIAVPTKVTVPTASPSTTQEPEIICSSLYSPVCSNNGVTYGSACEANLAGVTSFTEGECPKTKATPTKVISPTPKIIPVSN